MKKEKTVTDLTRKKMERSMKMKPFQKKMTQKDITFMKIQMKNSLLIVQIKKGHLRSVQDIRNNFLSCCVN